MINSREVKRGAVALTAPPDRVLSVLQDLPHTPTAHAEFLGGVLAALKSRGWPLGELSCVLNAKHSISTTTIPLTVPALHPPARFHYCLNVYENVDPYNGRARRVYVGATIDGQYGACFSEVVLHSDIRLPHEITAAKANGFRPDPKKGKRWRPENIAIDKVVGECYKMLSQIPSRVRSLANMTLTEKQVNWCVFQAQRLGFVPWDRARFVLDLYEKPGNRNDGWGLYEAFSEIAWRSPAHKQCRDLLGFYQLLTGQMPIS